MVDWQPAFAVAGKWILVVAVGIFVMTMIALLIYALRKGEAGGTDVAPNIQPFGPYSPAGRRGIIVYKGVRKLKMVASRETYVSIETLLSGTATPTQWALFTGIQIALVCFWLMFVGIGLLYAPATTALSVVFLVVPSLWYFGVLKTLWDDMVAARRKLTSADSQRELPP